MFKKNERITLTWKGFAFPISITSFDVSEDAKVATYEYAGRNGAEHERVLDYRKFHITGVFASTSGSFTPIYYVQKLRSLNDNKPGILFHPDLGSYKCILKSMKFNQAGEDNEATSDNSIYTNYSFDIEFWETTDPSQVTISNQLKQLFPAAVVKPTSDNYKTKLKYTTSDQLLVALIDGKIQAGLDPIVNSEWLSYPYDMRKNAYDRRIAGETLGTKSVNTSVQKTYTVKAGDSGIKIANSFKVNFNDLLSTNSGRNVRTQSRGTEGLKWKTPNLLYPGDNLLIP